MNNTRTYLFKTNAILSLNDHYFCMRKGRPILSSYARYYKEQIKNVLERIDKEFYNGERFITEPVAVVEDLTFLLTDKNMLFLNGNLRRRDISNFFKLAEDGIFNHFGIGDEWVVELHGKKRISSFFGILIKITKLEASTRDLVTEIPIDIQIDINKFSEFIDKNNLTCILKD